MRDWREQRRTYVSRATKYAALLDKSSRSAAERTEKYVHTHTTAAVKSPQPPQPHVTIGDERNGTYSQLADESTPMLLPTALTNGGGL